MASGASSSELYTPKDSIESIEATAILSRLMNVFVKINGKQHYLWRTVDQDGEVVDMYLQSERDRAKAKRSFRCLLGSHGVEPR